jgi:hypothetical protein
MERTLFCLLVSMTGGALILHFSQPNRSSDQRAGTHLIGRTAAQPWHAVHISPQPDAVASAATCSHFFIDHSGRTHPTDSWLREKSLGQPGVLQIGLQTARDSREITPAQWTAAMDLIRALKNTLRISIAEQDIRVDSGLTLPSTQSRRPTAIKPGLFASAWVR